jgi:hypothetical protein
MYALLSAIPYVICLGFHISKKDDKIQKIQLVNPEINGKLHEIDSMSKSSNKSNDSNTSSNSATTQLPGVNSSQVISSFPKLVKENSQSSSIKKESSSTKKE